MPHVSGFPPYSLFARLLLTRAGLLSSQAEIFTHASRFAACYLEDKTMKIHKVKFKDAYDEERISWYVRNELKGTWLNSSGCWPQKYLKLWYREDENRTYAHFPCDHCYTWEGNGVKDISKKIKAFIRRI